MMTDCKAGQREIEKRENKLESTKQYEECRKYVIETYGTLDDWNKMSDQMVVDRYKTMASEYDSVRN